jgi:hypothetical protein
VSLPTPPSPDQPTPPFGPTPQAGPSFGQSPFEQPAPAPRSAAFSVGQAGISPTDSTMDIGIVSGPEGTAGAPRRRSRKLLVGVIALVVALIAGGAAIAGAYIWYGWGTTEPEAVLPGSVSAYLRADFSPGLGQRLAVQNLAKRFPRDKGGGDDIVAKMQQGLVSGLFPSLDFDKDVAPWLGPRIGTGLWAPGGAPARPCTIAALASKDDAKATAALAKDTGLTYAFTKGYAVISRCSAPDGSASAAVAAGRSRSLADHGGFADALASLPSGQAVVAWADLASLQSLVSSAFSDSLGGTVTVTPSGPATAGTVIVAAKASDDGAEIALRLHLPGSPASVTSNALGQLGALSGNSTIGVAADLRGVKGLDQVFPSGGVGELPTGLPTDFPGFPTDFPSGFPTDFPTGFPSGFPTDFPTGFPSGFPTDFPTGVPELPGLAFPLIFGGIQPSAFNSAISLSITNVSVPDLKLVIDTANADEAQKVANSLKDLSDASAPQVTVAGAKVTAVSSGYEEGSTTLAKDALYRRAMAGGPSHSFLAGFVNMTKLAPTLHLSQSGAEQIKPLKAVGISLGTSDGDIVGQIRVVVQ